MDPSCNDLWRDIFRKADKNDDDKLSQEEFFSYFGDDYLTDKELSDLFVAIDANSNAIIEVEELIGFFSSGLEPYKALFSLVETGQTSVNNALHELNKNYSTLEPIEQFKVRFFLREFLNQIQLLHKPISTVLNKLQKSNVKSSTQYLTKSASVKTTYSKYSLQTEVERLSSLLTKLEKSQISLHFKEQTKVDKSPEPGNVIFSREMKIQEDFIQDFKDSTNTYLSTTNQEPGCLYTYVKRYSQKNHFVIYSVWTSMDHLSKHYLAPHYRSHIKSIIDYLLEPESINRMAIHTSWCIKSPM